MSVVLLVYFFIMPTSPQSSIRDKFVQSVRLRLIRSGMDASYFFGAKEFSGSICNAMRRGSLLLNGFEASTIMHLVRSTAKLEGEIAELGTYQGGSAHLICEVKGNTPLHLFDTFEGLPNATDADSGSGFAKGMFVSSEQRVRDYLVSFPSVFLHRGYFPGTAGPIEDKRFRLVHLDADLYEATKAGLDFFYPRMVRQGVILIHDCGAAGVERAYTEFLADKPEVLLFQPAGFHCLIVKA
jgi:hypothetical protein